MAEQSDGSPAPGCFDSFGLTPREAQVLVWVARGNTNGEIGEVLGINPLTVKKHLERIFRKLGVRNRTAAAVLAFRIQDGRAVDDSPPS